VTDKGFVYVVPMRRKGEVLQAIKQFAKEIRAPDAFIADMSGEHMSREVKKFCNDIGTTLRISLPRASRSKINSKPTTEL
jgi:hypothetical protein